MHTAAAFCAVSINRASCPDSNGTLCSRKMLFPYLKPASLHDSYLSLVGLLTLAFSNTLEVDFNFTGLIFLYGTKYFKFIENQDRSGIFGQAVPGVGRGVACYKLKLLCISVKV